MIAFYTEKAYHNIHSKYVNIHFIHLTKVNIIMTVADLQELFDIKRTRAYNLYKKMEAEGYIKVSGRGTGKKITLN